ncbi:hypothetical protein LJC63_12395 [Ruminococcaceae bacterium OttesenSCG-928-L11]|nr:hypothetical protein [Ruminococcaceae bacterium OttesenSCG-928-L11]
MKMKLTNRIALIGVLTALNTASRVFLQFLPNVKPVTSILIVSTIAFGLSFGLELAVTTVLVSSVLLGFGPWVPLQLLAWAVIVLMTWLINRFVPHHRLLLTTLWAFVSGYLYGFLVSLDKLMFGHVYFFTYYLAGLSFDTLHAVGNAIFYPLCHKALMPIFRRYGGRLHSTENIRKGETPGKS